MLAQRERDLGFQCLLFTNMKTAGLTLPPKAADILFTFPPTKRRPPTLDPRIFPMGKARKKTSRPLRLSDLWSEAMSLPQPMVTASIVASPEAQSLSSSLVSCSQTDSNLISDAIGYREGRAEINLGSPLTSPPSPSINDSKSGSPSLDGSQPHSSLFRYVSPRSASTATLLPLQPQANPTAFSPNVTVRCLPLCARPPTLT